MDRTGAEAKTFDDLLNELNDPTVLARDQEAKVFLNRIVFAGLTDLKPALDSPNIKHFDSADFEIVIERCTQHNVRVIGIEVFTPGAELVHVETAPDLPFSNAWCVELLDRYRGQPSLSYCATYDVPPEAIPR
jgi:hypothetical protein